MPKIQPLGNAESLKKGEQVMICRGMKFAGRNLFIFGNGDVAPIRARTFRFKDLSPAELSHLNLTGAKDYSKLLHEMRKTWPDMRENELVTLVFFDIEKKSPPGQGGKKKL